MAAPEKARIRRPYCLRCYAPMEAYSGSRCACEHCGYVNVKMDQRVFWTRERWLRELEQLAKILIVIFLGGIGVLMGLGLNGVRFGMGQGWAIGFPILIGFVFWETAAKITRRKPYFRATMVWQLMSGVLGAILLLLILGESSRSRGGVEANGPLAVSVVFFGGAFLIGRLGRALTRWRDRRILRGQDL